MIVLGIEPQHAWECQTFSHRAFSGVLTVIHGQSFLFLVLDVDHAMSVPVLSQHTLEDF